MRYDEYQFLEFTRHDDGILLITINRPDVLNATNARLHWELSRVWRDIDDDPEDQRRHHHRQGPCVFGGRRPRHDRGR